MHMKEELYTIGHVCLISGLSDRTIRGYIAMGLLEGEKINGLWHFTREQVGSFLNHPKVMPSIRAKSNGIIHDFLIDEKKTTREMALTLDLPGQEGKEVADYFCRHISLDGYENIRFSFSCFRGTPRVVLRGKPEDLMKLTGDFLREHPPI